LDWDIGNWIGILVWDIGRQFPINCQITRLPNYQIHNRLCGHIGSVDARPFGGRRLREEGLDRIRPPAGEQILLRNIPAPQDARHLRDKDVVFDEPAA
jgi:hypothetical protein